MTPTISMLLSSQVRIVHRRDTLMFSKRIVEHDGRQYIVLRFRRHATFVRYASMLEEITEAGASIQNIIARTMTVDQRRQYGYCLVLGYIPGRAIASNPAAASIRSLGRGLARLHSVEGVEREAPFVGSRPKLPHSTYLLATSGLSADERAWISSSQERLRSVRANQLTHGDFYAANIIVTSDRTVTLIDYDRMAFEWAGIELAIALLRPFSSDAGDRRLLVDSYLAHCGEAHAEIWRQHADDFIFAAAARLSLRRTRRRWRLFMTNALLRIRERFVSFRKDYVDERILANARKKEIADRHAVYFEHVARAMVRHRVGNSTETPLELLDRINAEFSSDQ